mmetsp:Transcript_20236/g.34267  ORF Transcript_20236/g.34267 Transcript_20236/m.34267 type:complete len:496 (-) Transcript_20236:2446-3933(-)
MTRLAAYTAPILLVLFSGAATAATRQQYGLAFLHATPSSPIRHYPNIPSSMFSSTIDEIPSDAPIDTSSSGSGDPEGVLQARNRLIALSKALTSNSPTGKFITRPSSTKKFQQAIADLEAVASSTTSSSREKELLVGDWKLIATANVPSSDIRRRITEKQSSSSSSSDKKKSWFNMPQARSGLSSDNSSSLNPIQKSIQKSFQVTQRIRNDGAEDEEINRVDNVVEFTPLDSLDDIFPKESPLSNIFGQINVNPLQVKKGKVVLIHKAEVESVSPILRTKIAWTSSVLNVAGTSQYFDESGSDIFGVNNLLGEFLSVGSFDTPFVDEDVRVSRSTSGPILEQLRVFVRVGSNILDEGMLDSLTAEMRVEEEIEVSSSSIESQMKTVTDAAENVREKVTDALGDAMDDVVERVQDVVEADLEEVGKAVEEVQAGGDIVEAVSNATKAVAKVPADVGNVVAEDVAVVVDKLQDAVSGDDEEEADDSEKDDEKEENED